MPITTKEEKQSMYFGLGLLLIFPIIIGLVNWAEQKKQTNEDEGDG